MGKKIAKTSLYTLLSLMLILIIGFSFACLIAPASLSDFTKKINLDWLSTELAVYQYKKSGDINDLGVSVERAIDSSSHGHIKNYADKLIRHEQYGAFVAYKNKQFDAVNTSDIAFYYDNFIEANYIYSCYKEDGNSDALFIQATRFVDKTDNEYLLSNPVSMYVKAFKDDEDKNQLIVITTYLSSKYTEMTGENNPAYNADTKRICYDLYSVYSSVGDTSNMTKWKKLYESVVL